MDFIRDQRVSTDRAPDNYNIGVNSNSIYQKITPITQILPLTKEKQIIEVSSQGSIIQRKSPELTRNTQYIPQQNPSFKNTQVTPQMRFYNQNTVQPQQLVYEKPQVIIEKQIINNDEINRLNSIINGLNQKIRNLEERPPQVIERVQYVEDTDKLAKAQTELDGLRTQNEAYRNSNETMSQKIRDLEAQLLYVKSLERKNELLSIDLDHASCEIRRLEAIAFQEQLEIDKMSHAFHVKIQESKELMKGIDKIEYQDYEIQRLRNLLDLKQKEIDIMRGGVRNQIVLQQAPQKNSVQNISVGVMNSQQYPQQFGYGDPKQIVKTMGNLQNLTLVPKLGEYPKSYASQSYTL